MYKSKNILQVDLHGISSLEHSSGELIKNCSIQLN